MQTQLATASAIIIIVGMLASILLAAVRKS
jgi:hypothetical protein